jgi:hypothetical protein
MIIFSYFLVWLGGFFMGYGIRTMIANKENKAVKAFAQKMYEKQRDLK